MTLPAYAALQARARKIREQTTIRAWEYRQRNHSKGVWFRLRRVLVDASAAFAIDATDSERLEASGAVPLPVGHELEPKKRIFFVSRAELERLESARPVRLALCAELLEAPNLALTRLREP